MFFSPSDRVNPKQSRMTISKKKEFQDKYSLENRKEQCANLKLKYPNRIPVFICHAKNTNDLLNDLEKNKYLIEKDSCFSLLMNSVATNLSAGSTVNIFFFINDSVIPPPNAQMSDLYEKYRDTDNFLYISYTAENTFG